jgi:alkylation response protein AidB-like acyl-CoA dehydrogenase
MLLAEDIRGELPLHSEDDQALCAELLGRVAAISDGLKASTAESESLQRLSPASLGLLKSSGVLNMRLVKEQGGLEASIATQCRVIAAIAEADSASGWCAMIHNNGVGTIAAYFPDTALRQIFRAGIPIVSNVAAPSGTARKTDDGFAISGRWRFCSGFHNASWLLCVAKLEDGGRELLIAVPQSDATPVDNWNVFGLRGTGSVDFILDDYRLPAAFAIDNAARHQLRGSRLYSRPGILIAAYEHAAWAWGVGRRSLNLLREQLARLGPVLATREVLVAEIGRLSIELEAAACLMIDYYTYLETLSAAESADPVVASKGPAIAALITSAAAACTDAAFRRAGTRAAFLPNDIEVTMRDMKVAQAHIVVGDSTYAVHGTAIVNDCSAAI